MQERRTIFDVFYFFIIAKIEMPVSKFRSESKQTDEINNSRSNSSNSHRSWCFIYHGKEKEMKSIPNN